MTETQTFHTLTRSERDHLLAVAQLTDQTASGQDIQAYIETLRCGERPSNSTTYATLSTLVERDLLSKSTVDGKTSAYEPTEYGWALLEEAGGVIPDSGVTNPTDTNQ